MKNIFHLNLISFLICLVDVFISNKLRHFKTSSSETLQLLPFDRMIVILPEILLDFLLLENSWNAPEFAWKIPEI